MDLTWQWARRGSMCIMSTELSDSIAVSISLFCDDRFLKMGTYFIPHVRKEGVKVPRKLNCGIFHEDYKKHENIQK